MDQTNAFSMNAHKMKLCAMCNRRQPAAHVVL